MPRTFQILLIDDHENDPLLLRAAWESAYPICNLTWAGTESQLQQIIDQPHYRPDLIFLSWHADYPYGLEQVKRLKSSPTYRQIPLIVLIDVAWQDSKEIYQAGANSVIVKPEKPEAWANLASNVGSYWLNESVKLTTRSNSQAS